MHEPQAARLRASNLKDKHREEAPKPHRKFDIAGRHKVKGVPIQIVGYEWGGDYREVRRDVWVYKCKFLEGTSIGQTFDICEEDIEQ